jgi:hypothetical protein
MIDFQSSAIAKSASHRPCHSLPGAPAPGGDLSRLGFEQLGKLRKGFVPRSGTKAVRPTERGAREPTGERNVFRPSERRSQSDRVSGRLPRSTWRASQRRDEGELNRSRGRKPALIGMSLQKCATRYDVFGIRVNSRNSGIRLCVSAAKIRVYPPASPKLGEGGAHPWLKKGRNCETNPIFIASFCRPGGNKEINSNSTISETHQWLGHVCSVRKLFKAF